MAAFESYTIVTIPLFSTPDSGVVELDFRFHADQTFVYL